MESNIPHIIESVILSGYGMGNVPSQECFRTLNVAQQQAQNFIQNEKSKGINDKDRLACLQTKFFVKSFTQNGGIQNCIIYQDRFKAVMDYWDNVECKQTH